MGQRRDFYHPLPGPPVAVLVGAVEFVSTAAGVEVAVEWKYQNY